MEGEITCSDAVEVDCHHRLGLCGVRKKMILRKKKIKGDSPFSMEPIQGEISALRATILPYS